jgi:D-alanyl-D-alanine carboxypeptidase
VEQALDDALTQTMAQYNVPGAVVGIWIPGAGTWVVSRGVADPATGRAMQLGDRFRIRSNTKTFTVTCCLLSPAEMKATDMSPLRFALCGLTTGVVEDILLAS